MTIEIRNILREAQHVSLSTLNRDSGFPYSSFSAVATLQDATPVFLWSDLAEHTKNIQKDHRIGILCEGREKPSNPQATPRISLIGNAIKDNSEAVRQCYLAKHPSAKGYESFGDFNYYRFNLEKVHVVAGFGKAFWLEKEEFLCPEKIANHLTENQGLLLADLQENDPDFATRSLQQYFNIESETARLIRIDPDGIDMRTHSKNYRIPFMKTINDTSFTIHALSSYLKSG